MLQSIKMALRSIKGNKLRSALTMLGMIIGVSSVIILVSIAQGSAKNVTSQINQLGTNLLTINTFGTDLALTEDKISKLSNLNGVKAVSPVITGRVNVKKDRTTSQVTLTGTNASQNTGKFEGSTINMKKMRRAHLWIGLIASILIFMESITGLLINEPWLIGQSQVEGGRGNFQPGQFNQGQFYQRQGGQGITSDSGQTQGQTGSNENGQFQGPPGFGRNNNFAGGPRGDGMGQGTLLSTIRGLHEGRIGNTNVKWLIDLTALAMMFLTGSGIYLSIKVLRAESKSKKRQNEDLDILAN
ncbi:ABC transporter permease [Neobacillus sp. WH10]|uniref:ABC transporter permease n=1 Tax=Neobacillus sp. WH10 TaxID=3047873 RepID=UPI0024C1C30E|nr:ABC transporter permease [Neobacillus sp. WH10]WHY80111.1 ABC transporter permease [Neobacillus sp. WH10]